MFIFIIQKKYIYIIQNINVDYSILDSYIYTYNILICYTLLFSLYDDLFNVTSPIYYNYFTIYELIHLIIYLSVDLMSKYLLSYNLSYIILILSSFKIHSYLLSYLVNVYINSLTLPNYIFEHKY